MKMSAFLFRVLSGRAAGMLLGLASLGAVGGVVVALLTIGEEPKTYDAWSQVHPEIIAGDSLAATPEAQQAWAQQLAAEMQAPDFLAAAAKAAGMDRERGLSPEQCAGILAASLRVQVTQEDRRRGGPPARGSLLLLTISGNDAKECAAVLDGMRDELIRHVKDTNAALAAKSPAHQQYIARTADMPALAEEIARRTEELRTAIAGASTRPAEQSPEELLAMTPPLVAREAHAALRTATERLAQLRKEAAQLSTATGAYACYPWGGSGEPVYASGPVWTAYAWPRALTGAGAGGVMALLVLAAGRRNSVRPQPLSPPVPNY